MSNSPDTPSLYGDEAPKVAPSRAIPLGEYLQGVFTAPADLCRRLGESPTWAAPMVLMVATGLLLSALWVWKLDPVALVQANLDVTGQWMSRLGQSIPEAAIQDALDQAKRPVASTLAGALLGPWAIFAVMALLLWGGARMGALMDAEPATFRQAFGVVVLQAVPLALTQVLTALIVLLKPVGGLTVMALNPASVGYFLAPEGLLLRGFTVGVLDPLYLFSWVLLALGMKHTLKAKTWAIVVTLGVMALVSLPMRMVGGMY